MSLSVKYSNSVKGKSVKIVAGAATYRYTGLAEIPANVVEQLRFFGHWDDVLAFLPPTPGYESKEALQQAVNAAAMGDCAPAQALLGYKGDDCGVHQTGQPGFRISVVPMGGKPAGSHPIDLYDLSTMAPLDLGSTPEIIKRAPNHGQPWSRGHESSLMRWWDQAIGMGKVVNCVTAGRLLGRTPYAVLCKLTALKLLNEHTAYRVIEALIKAMRAEQDAVRNMKAMNKALHHRAQASHCGCETGGFSPGTPGEGFTHGHEW